MDGAVTHVQNISKYRRVECVGEGGCEDFEFILNKT